MKSLIIHCGLHKTGTTSLQSSLRREAGALRARGVLYPDIGLRQQLSGQHNIAWQIARDRRFREAAGDVDALFAEIAAFEGTTIISSEDFEGCLLHPENWNPLIRRAQALNCQTTMIIYLREVSSYLESAYCETLLHDSGLEYPAFAREIAHFGRIRIRDWEFCFNYDAISRAMASLPGVKVVFRSYENLIEGSTIADFATILRLPDDLKARLMAEPANNQRRPLSELVKKFLSLRDETFKDEDISRPIVASMLRTDQARLATPPALASTLRTRLRSSVYDSLTANSATPKTRPPSPNALAAPVFNISRVFSFETQVAARRMYRLLRSAGAGAEAPAAFTAEADAWRQWAMTMA